MKTAREQDKTTRLLTARVEPLILSLAVPTILTMLITTFYNMADAFFVGTINPSASGAVGVVFSLMAIIQALGFFFGHGSGNYISKKLGAGDRESAETMAITGFLSSMAFGALLAVLGQIFISPLSYFLGSTPTIEPYAVDYLRFILIGAPFMTSALTLNNQLRFQGSAAYAMIGMCTGGIINVGLDALFIMGLGMGTLGAGLATAISQTISFTMLVFGTLRGGNLRLKIKKFTFSPKFYAEIARGGLPSLARQGSSSIAVISLNHVLALVSGNFVDEAIAAMGIVAKISNFFFSIVVGLGQGFQPVCGFNYGAKKYERVLKGYRFSLIVAAVFAMAIALFGILFASPLTWLFTDSEKVVEIALPALKSQCAALSLTAMATISNMLLQNIGKVVGATVLAIGRQGLFYLPVLFIMQAIWGLWGVQLSQSVAEALTFFASIPLTFPTLKELRRNVTI